MTRRARLVGGPREGKSVPNRGAFFVRDGDVYRWHPEWEAYVHDWSSRLCLNCLAIVEVPSEETCPLCGYAEGEVWEDAE